MELYVERGFDETTVAEIAKRAGLTERTFFRHFADKREVLFAGAAMLQELLVSTVADAPPALAPVDAAMAGVVAGAPSFRSAGPSPAGATRSLRPIRSCKSASSASWRRSRRRWPTPCAGAVPDHAASLAAEVAIAVFRVAFERWVADPVHLDLPQLMRTSLDELRAVTTNGGTGHHTATTAP